MRLRLLTALALAAPAAAAACQVIAGIERVEKDVLADGVDGSTDDDSDVVSAPSDPCAHALPPPPPEVDDDPDGTIPPMYLAVRTLNLSHRDDDSLVGFDLDRVCTCEERPATAHGGASSCTPKQRVCDEDGGIDNRAAILFEAISGSSGSGSPDEQSNDAIADGSQSVLLHIAGWNGKPNDREVFVGVMASYGIVDPSGCGVDSGKEFHPPQWCGHDKWTYPPEGAIATGGQIVPIRRSKGHVTDGQLVLESDAAIPVVLGNVAFSFGTPTIAGRLEKIDEGYRLTGLLAGRIPIGDILTTAGQTEVKSDQSGKREPLCTTPLFDSIKSVLCGSVDVRQTSAFDFKEGACDAISSAITFTAESAELGGTRAAPPWSGPCVPTGPDDPRYVCPD